MVFMVSDSDLELYADLDLADLQSAGSGRHLNIVVQVDRRRYKDPARFVIEPRSGRRRLVSLPRRQRNAGEARVLENFLNWTTSHYPARKYLLVLWGHAFGLGFGEERGNALTVWELAAVLKRLAERRSAKLDLLGFDACSMSTAEAAYQLRDGVRFLAASQVGLPYAGWPYARIVKRIQTNPSISANRLGRTIVREFIQSYQPPTVALALVNLDPQVLSNLKKNVDALAASLRTAVRNSRVQRRMNALFRRVANRGPGRPERALIDLGNLCAELAVRGPDAATRAAAQRARQAVSQTLVSHEASPRRFNRTLNGLGVYAPNVARGSEWHTSPAFARSYERLMFSRETVWDELVYNLRRRR